MKRKKIPNRQVTIVCTVGSLFAALSAAATFQDNLKFRPKGPKPKGQFACEATTAEAVESTFCG